MTRSVTTAPTTAATTTATRATDKNPIPTTQPESPDLPVPFLTAEEAIATFNLPPGFRAEVVAAEPMVQHPVAMTFDADGRIWVCEMRGYMPNPQGSGEEAPAGRVSILEDTNGDGRMDKSTLFMDKLVLPRAIAIVRDGALVAVPPNLFFCRDTNGDGTADEKTIVAPDFGDPRQNPEHQANGLVLGLDNWLHNANYGRRLRDVAGKWTFDSVPDIGQWGISQDDFGRLFTNNNSNYLRADLVPSHYTSRNPHYGGSGANIEIDSDQTCWPAHPSAVNRGYRDNYLRDGRLRNFTATCSPLVYRGDLFPKEFRGNVFVAEPSANLIRRAVLTEQGLELTGKNAYDSREFLASTYERFRPVSLYNGPDGALYVVDMHHGLLQHRQYLTPYLKHKYLGRLLDQFLLTGRIYRIVPDSAKIAPTPGLSKAKSADLIAALSHPNGWMRDTAQRLLVERNYSGATGAIKKLATSGETPLARLHALWTLEGMRRLDAATVRAALNDSDPRVRAAAIRVSEFLLNHGRADEIITDVLKLSGDADPHVRLQFALTLSEIGSPQVEQAIAALLHDVSDSYTRDAVITGLRGRELEFIEKLLGDARHWQSPGASEAASESAAEKDPKRVAAFGRAKTLAALARAVRGEGKPRRIARLLDLMSTQTGSLAWRQEAMIQGITEVRRTRPLLLDAEPTGLAKLKASPEQAPVLQAMFVWPGKAGYVPPLPPPPLTPPQQARFVAGKNVYAATCMQCHKSDGMGQVGLAPPLVDSDWILGPEERVARIVLNGIRGPITIGGVRFNLDMPGLGTLRDEQVADVLTYVRREWDHAANPVAPETIARIRAELNGRSEAWTEKELLSVPVHKPKPAAAPSALLPAAATQRARVTAR
ncbi:MAG: PVC-type heme-binding CxxCH protein [Tepidisphaeraceae bacterium]